MFDQLHSEHSQETGVASPSAWFVTRSNQIEQQRQQKKQNNKLSDSG